ncbi:RelA/SpoT domain-containing protein [Mesorhizobium sp. M0145]|uniref:RelA/SpoT domain-containing protein n=1 Tax=Mesorhizobium sp. M0145 TaxID=2956895 RepID=UPI00333A602D
MDDVRAAGKRLAGKVYFDSANYREALETFTVANSWRDSHIRPTRSIRASVRSHMRQACIPGDMASRPKRMSSIRRKLGDTTIRLDQMQDLGGCRAILNDIDGIDKLVDRIRGRSPHGIRREWNYIQNPKEDGYRSHHISLEFQPNTRQDDAYVGRRIELQIRTRLQHSWATAVEAVSLYRNQDLKHHKGDADWLRLFVLAAAEFAHVERCPLPEGVPERTERIRELKDLNARLGAVSMLQNIRAATHFAENFVYERGRYYLIRYHPDHTVKIKTYPDTMSATYELGIAERAIEAGENQEKVVLVQVDKIDKLVATYPNYFGDVSLFIRNLQLACLGRPGLEYTIAPQEVVRPREIEKPNFGLLHRRYTQWIEPRR